MVMAMVAMCVCPSATMAQNDHLKSVVRENVLLSSSVVMLCSPPFGNTLTMKSPADQVNQLGFL